MGTIAFGFTESQHGDAVARKDCAEGRNTSGQSSGSRIEREHIRPGALRGQVSQRTPKRRARFEKRRLRDCWARTIRPSPAVYRPNADERRCNVMIARGCMAHQCTIEEAILAFDLSNGKPYVAIKSTRLWGGGGFKIFAEDKTASPRRLTRRDAESMRRK